MDEIEREIRGTVRKLFEDNRIGLFIGYIKGSLPLRTTPGFINGLAGIETLVWNSFCRNNLTVYLPRFFAPDPRRKEAKLPSIGVLVKGCDSRSLVNLINENQIPRENLCIIGVNCAGLVDESKIQDSMGEARMNEIIEVDEEKDGIMIIDEEKHRMKFKKEDVLADVCLNCKYPTPVLYDILVGGKASQKHLSVRKDDRVESFEKKNIEERWKYFQEQVSKCIRCYACRQACPNCYCKLCFAEQTKPKWVGTGNDISDIMFYQIGRIFHQAGRCVDCGACVRACPVNIDLRIFTSKLVKDVKELFDYEAGLSLEEVPPLANFKPEDTQGFITEP